METDDPRAALKAKDLPTQAAGARDLALVGTWDDLDELLELATSHKRTGLRLIAAAAAADILHRTRTGAAEHAPSRDQIEAVLERVKRTDPGLNPSSLMLLSAFPERTVIDRLGRFLRDPRNDVRTGAAVAVRRMAVSHTLIDHPGKAVLQAAIGRWLADRRTPPDALTALVSLVGNLGWESLSDAVFGVQSGSAPVVEAVTLARERLNACKSLDAFSGIYVSDGLDALEQDAAAREGGLLLVHGGSVVVDSADAVPVELDDGRLRTAALDGAARLVWIPRLGVHEMQAALQVPGRTWYRLEGKEAVQWVDANGHLLEARHRPAAGGLLPTIAELEGAVGARGRAIGSWLEGDLDAADEALTSLTDAKKPRADLFFWLARLRLEQGRTDAARDALTRFLDKASKRAPFRPAAEALLESL